MNGNELTRALESTLNTRVRELSAVTGGDINQAHRARLEGGRTVFVKTHAAPPKGMYVREAEGLSFLREAGALRIPEVLAADERMLVLEWLDSAPRSQDFDEQLGRGLAQLHQRSPGAFGWMQHNYVGSVPQLNTPSPDWPSFYAERRLLPLAQHAQSRGLLPPGVHARVQALCKRLPELCGPEEPPARLHGDLWGGNIMADESGSPVLIDPAVYGGHREIDLAMMQLFGAPSARFFAAYDEVYPRTPEADDRVLLYQIYPLLVHVCLFGKSYASQLSHAISEYE